MIEEVSAISAPILVKYSNTLAEYVDSVTKSLYLKIQIMSQEVKLKSYDFSTCERFKAINSATNNLIEEVGKTIELGKTNLLLFKQLGPSLYMMSQQYQSILDQIKFVREDLGHLSYVMRDGHL